MTCYNTSTTHNSCTCLIHLIHLFTLDMFDIQFKRIDNVLCFLSGFDTQIALLSKKYQLALFVCACVHACACVCVRASATHMCIYVCVIDDTTNSVCKHWQPSYLLSDSEGNVHVSSCSSSSFISLSFLSSYPFILSIHTDVLMLIRSISLSQTVCIAYY